MNFLTTTRTDDAIQNATLDKVAALARQFKPDAARTVVCMFAASVFGFGPETILPEIEKSRTDLFRSRPTRRRDSR